jgi:hypothetical protein
MTNTIPIPKRAGDPTRLLAHLGTIPFLAGALLLTAGIQRIGTALDTVTLMGSYGLAIISFMAGTLWGVSKRSVGASEHGILVVSNVVTLAAWVGFLILPSPLLLLLLTLLFPLLLAADYQLMKQAQITISYFRLRCHVTGVVVAALLVSLIFL